MNRFGEPVDYPTGPVLFGEPGTNGQHSFYQLLHQGTDIVPLQFIAFKNSQIGTDVEIQGSTSQKKLCANVAAQIVAFACGKKDENSNKNFKGGRPSSIIIGEQGNGSVPVSMEEQLLQGNQVRYARKRQSTHQA